MRAYHKVSTEQHGLLNGLLILSFTRITKIEFQPFFVRQNLSSLLVVLQTRSNFFFSAVVVVLVAFMDFFLLQYKTIK